jgi:hypothetical protein
VLSETARSDVLSLGVDTSFVLTIYTFRFFGRGFPRKSLLELKSNLRASRDARCSSQKEPESSLHRPEEGEETHRSHTQRLFATPIISTQQSYNHRLRVLDS